jgi:hypothetical protein
MIEFNAVAIAVIISVFFILSWFFSKSLMRGLVSVGISTVLITGLLFIAPLIFGWNFGQLQVQEQLAVVSVIFAISFLGSFLVVKRAANTPAMPQQV